MTSGIGFSSFLQNGVSLDLEVRREIGRIHAFGAVRVDTGESLTRSQG